MKIRALDEQPLSTDIRMCEGLFVRHCVFEAGSYIPQHSHEWEHLSVIAAGSVRVWTNDTLIGDFTAPAGIVIKAGVQHLFLALERAAVLCVHRVDGNGEPVTIDEPHFVTYGED